MTSDIKAIDDEIWVVESPQKFLGLEIGTRMTVIRLPNSKLLLISPTPINPNISQELQSLGTVTYLVAPNKFHHLYIGEWKQAFPKALIYVAPGLENKRPDLDITGVLSDTVESVWALTLEQALMEGFPLVNEIIFFHPSTATVIITDTAFNIGSHSPLSTRLAFFISGAYGRLSHTLLERLMILDQKKFKQSLERVLNWPIKRVILSHGDIIEEGGRESLARTYRWLK